MKHSLGRPLAVSFLFIGSLLGLSACPRGGDQEFLKLKGSIRTGNSPAIGVNVRAQCGENVAEVVCDSNGKYELEVGYSDCDQINVLYEKESYLPAVQTFTAPPPSGSLTNDVELESLEEVKCGSSGCRVSGSDSDFPAGHFARGWVLATGGKNALDIAGGRFRDDQDRLVWMMGLLHFDFRDVDGARIERFEQGFKECFKILPDDQGWLVDTLPETDLVELSWYELDFGAGRWKQRPEPVTVEYEIDSVAGVPVLQAAKRDELADIVARKFKHPNVWACATLPGSGRFAFGQSLPAKSCVLFDVRDPCKTPIPDALFSMTGRTFGFFEKVWTDRRGKACVEVVPSEELSADVDGDPVFGETFFVDFEVGRSGTAGQRDSFSSPRSTGTCAEPDTCDRPSVITLPDPSGSCKGP